MTPVIATTPNTVEITPVKNYDSLYCKYPGQSNPQPCYIELVLDRGIAYLSADYDAEIGNAVPASVYHGRTLRWTIACLTGEAADRLIGEILPLAQLVHDGYKTKWDGNNHVGTLTEDAQAASEEIEGICRATLDADEGDTVQVWSAADYGYQITYADEDGASCTWREATTATIDGHTITATTTDAELSVIETALGPEGVRVDGILDMLEIERSYCIANC